MADQDSVWKEIITAFLIEFLAFFFPKVYQEVDWSKPWEFLDKELSKLAPDSETGNRFADKLVKVFLKSGEEQWLLIHIEVQGYYDASFAERMFIYNYRIFDLYHKPVVSLALFTDESATYRPNTWELKFADFEHTFKFPLVKLVDYRKDWDKLGQNTNPFAVVTMAHLKLRELSKTDPDALLAWKEQLVFMLYERGYSREWVRQLFRFIDWLIRLPANLTLKFREDVYKYEEERKVAYVTSIEQLGIEKEAIAYAVRLIKRKFGTIEVETEQNVQKLTKEQLEELGEALFEMKDNTDLINWLSQHQPKQ